MTIKKPQSTHPNFLVGECKYEPPQIYNGTYIFTRVSHTTPERYITAYRNIHTSNPNKQLLYRGYHHQFIGANVSLIDNNSKYKITITSTELYPISFGTICSQLLEKKIEGNSTSKLNDYSLIKANDYQSLYVHLDEIAEAIKMQSNPSLFYTELFGAFLLKTDWYLLSRLYADIIVSSNPSKKLDSIAIEYIQRLSEKFYKDDIEAFNNYKYHDIDVKLHREAND